MNQGPRGLGAEAAESGWRGSVFGAQGFRVQGLGFRGLGFRVLKVFRV